ncbi:hypothetical protein [Phyllobacterium sophorae]|uniref:hypothetical protein n=1 Tax=Phyllobacterium sophorae TaxID=1520277 RepID=UPI001AEC9491|nr:hypothetical protein [Phyllobacterium sophorae]
MNAGWFRGLLGILFLSGLARGAAALQFGLPGRALNAAIVAELVGVPLLLAWHTALTRKAVLIPFRPLIATNHTST